jgi:hypothetical protein
MGVADQQSNWSKCPFLALNGTAKLARSCPLSEADRKSFERSEHLR